MTTRRILVGCYEVPGYGGASTASYRLFQRLRERGLDVEFVNLVDERDAEFFAFMFGESWGNPSRLAGVHNLVLRGPVYHAHPELAGFVSARGSDVLIGVGFIAALLLKRAAPSVPTLFLTSGCQQMKDAIIRHSASDFLAVRREIDRGIRRAPISSTEERDAVTLADAIVVHSEMTARLMEHYFPFHTGKILGEILSFAPWIYADAMELSHVAMPFDERDIDALFVASDWSRPEKNRQFVVRIAAELRDLSIHVAGEDDQPIANVVHHGLVADREALFKLMGRSRTVVCPSRFDTAPGILFEAAALGCNLVASENCGNFRICHDALLVRRFHPDDFASCVRKARPRRFDDNRQLFLDPAPFEAFLETLDVL